MDFDCFITVISLTALLEYLDCPYPICIVGLTKRVEGGVDLLPVHPPESAPDSPYSLQNNFQK